MRQLYALKLKELLFYGMAKRGLIENFRNSSWGSKKNIGYIYNYLF